MARAREGRSGGGATADPAMKRRTPQTLFGWHGLNPWEDILQTVIKWIPC
jgi:hypothetical protein